MSHVTTHVLDAALGRPAEGISVFLLTAAGDTLASGVTNSDGRIAEFGPSLLDPGHYSVVFAVAPYFEALNIASFYPRVVIDFVITDASHYHVPLLLSPFAFSTYRGS